MQHNAVISNLVYYMNFVINWSTIPNLCDMYDVNIMSERDGSAAAMIALSGVCIRSINN